MEIEIKKVRDISYDDAEIEIYEYIHDADHYVYVSELAEKLCIDLEIIEDIHHKIIQMRMDSYI